MNATTMAAPRHARSTTLPAPDRSAERAVAVAGAMVEPIGLADLTALAELQTRVDRKYFVAADVFCRLIDRMALDLRVLEIDGQRSFGYESVYFDTADLFTYRAHVQRRRRRFKVRTRTYADTGLCMFEVKLSGTRGETVKQRVPHPGDRRAELTEPALAHLAAALESAHHHDLPTGLAPSVGTTYRRTTFVTRAGDARLTCDVNLVCHDPAHEVRDRGTHVLVESKSSRHGDSAADRLLRDLGVRPVSVSKYCVGIAALHPDLPSNPWHPILRRYFTPRQTAV
jgi:hypothetical protein